jgi:hypothetical protein
MTYSLHRVYRAGEQTVHTVAFVHLVVDKAVCHISEHGNVNEYRNMFLCPRNFEARWEAEKCEKPGSEYFQL